MADQWLDCYDESWNKIIVKEAFSHPAKFSRGLIQRIYAHAVEMGWLKPGDIIVDPFAGVALGALYAGKYIWIGVELEEKFVKLGLENIKKWEIEDRAIIIQGDSRKLRDVIKKADLVVSSPPFLSNSTTDTEFANKHHQDIGRKIDSPGAKSLIKDYGTPGNLGNMKEGDIDLVVASPPYAGSLNAKEDGIDWTKGSDGKGGVRDFTKEPGQKIRKRMGKEYGETEGQLGSMKEGDVDLVVASPPFMAAEVRDKKPIQEGYVSDCMKRSYASKNVGDTEGQLGSMKEGDVDLVVASPPYSHDGLGHTKIASEIDIEKKLYGAMAGNKYGETDGQLGNMKDGDVDVVVSSPPYESEQITQWISGGKGGDIELRKKLRKDGVWEGYNKKDINNLGNSSGDTFWSASREIVQQCYELLKPGGHAIWVCKDYVKNKKRVPFSDRWQKLCESVGFKLVCRHQAMLVKKHKGIIMETTKERKSFFRRLAEGKGSPKIDWEDVLCMEK